MRARLTLLLTTLLAVTLVSLGVPFARILAADQGRRLHQDRSADVARFAGLVSATPDAASELALARELRRYEDLYGIAAAVFDAAGRVDIASGPGIAADTPAVRDAVATALAGRLSEPPEELWPWDSAPLVVARPAVRDGDVVAAVVSVSATDRARRRVLRDWLLLAVAELVALGGGALLALRLSRWVVGPVSTLSKAARRIADGDLAARVQAAAGPPELRRLTRSFNDMADHVQASVEAQRAFVADAEHQLRNPLNALLVRLDGLELAGPPAVRASARSAAEDGRYLAATLDRMLELARAEHADAEPGPVDVGAVVDDRLASWQVVAARRSIELSRIGLPHVTGWHERAAVAGAVDAVVDNALKYSPERSGVSVDVGVNGSMAVITVSDQGPGLEPAELPRAADRFWRSRREAGTEGSGLGLSIASALLERRSGRLEVSSSDCGGLRVSLQVPLAPAAGRVDQGLLRR